jgi:hypothetical protein
MSKSLAWPATVIALLIILRHQLRSLVSDLRRLKCKDFEAYFDKSLEQANAEADEAGLPPLPGRSHVSELTRITEPRFERLVEASPRAGILETWFDVEAAIRELASKHNVPASERFPVRALAQQLHLQEVLSQSDLRLFDILRQMRNAAAHSLADFTVDQAREFRHLASRLIDGLLQK